MRIIFVILFLMMLANNIYANAANVSYGEMSQALKAARGQLGGGAVGTMEKAMTANLKQMNKAIESATDSGGSKRKWGIAGTIVTYALKVRTAVRYTYEEIMLWRGVARQYRELTSWLKNAGEHIVKFGDNIGDFFTGDGNALEKLEQLVGIYDDWDHISKVMPKTLDYKLANLERSWDELVRDTFTYNLGPWSHTLGWTPGTLVPNTAKTFEWLDDKLQDNKYFQKIARTSDSLEAEWRSRWISDSLIAAGGGDPVVTLPREMPDINDPFRKYTQPIISNQIAISTAMANSLEYRKWAQKALSNLDELDRKLLRIAEKTDRDNMGITGHEMAAAWYSIENVNATNKQLRHSVEEAKLQQALLGTELHVRQGIREQQLHLVIQNYDR